MKLPDFNAIIAEAQATPFLGRAIVFFRTLRGMTQEDLARITKLNLSAIKRLEKGRKRGGWPSSLELVCKALNISVGQLYEQALKLALADELRMVFLQFFKVASCFFAIAAAP